MYYNDGGYVGSMSKDEFQAFQGRNQLASEAYKKHRSQKAFEEMAEFNKVSVLIDAVADSFDPKQATDSRAAAEQSIVRNYYASLSPVERVMISEYAVKSLFHYITSDQASSEPFKKAAAWFVQTASGSAPNRLIKLVCDQLRFSPVKAYEARVIAMKEVVQNSPQYGNLQTHECTEEDENDKQSKFRILDRFEKIAGVRVSKSKAWSESQKDPSDSAQLAKPVEIPMSIASGATCRQNDTTELLAEAESRIPKAAPTFYYWFRYEKGACRLQGVVKKLREKKFEFQLTTGNPNEPRSRAIPFTDFKTLAKSLKWTSTELQVEKPSNTAESLSPSVRMAAGGTAR